VQIQVEVRSRNLLLICGVLDFGDGNGFWGVGLGGLNRGYESEVGFLMTS
jgi:hypothetical protein